MRCRMQVQSHGAHWRPLMKSLKRFVDEKAIFGCSLAGMLCIIPYVVEK